MKTIIDNSAWNPVAYTGKAYRNESMVPGCANKTGGIVKGRSYIISRAHYCCNIHKCEMLSVTGTFDGGTQAETKYYYSRDLQQVVRMDRVARDPRKN